MSYYGSELGRAKRMNSVLGDQRPDVIRTRDLKLRRGVSSFRVPRGFHCGSAQDLVISQLMLRVSRDSLSKQQREFLIASMFHVGVLGLQPCPKCMPLLRLLRLYERWWQERSVLEGWERVSSLDPERMRRPDIKQVAIVIQRRLDYMEAVQERYDPVTGKLHY